MTTETICGYCKKVHPTREAARVCDDSHRQPVCAIVTLSTPEGELREMHSVNPAWVHADYSAGNCLLKEGEILAVEIVGNDAQRIEFWREYGAAIAGLARKA